MDRHLMLEAPIWKRLLSRTKTPVVLKKQECHDDLDLIRSEESTRTCMLAVSEAHVVYGRRDELMLVLFAWPLPHLQVTPGIKL